MQHAAKPTPNLLEQRLQVGLGEELGHPADKEAEEVRGVGPAQELVLAQLVGRKVKLVRAQRRRVLLCVLLGCRRGKMVSEKAAGIDDDDG